MMQVTMKRPHLVDLLLDIGGSEAVGWVGFA